MFAATDGMMAGKVVIVNETFVREFFGDADPIGQRIAYTGDVLKFTPISGDWRTIVGVASDTRDGGLDVPVRAAVYMPFAQMISFGGGLVVRADSNVAAQIPAITRIVRRLAPTAPIENVMTIAQFKDVTIAPRRVNAALISSFGALALLIAAVGIAGVLAFSVSARTNEIGIRMSLGADAGRVQRMVLGEGGVLLAIGLVLGVVAAYFAAGFMGSLLYDVQPHDPMTFGMVAVVMSLIGIGACWMPARRASRIDPAITMRS
jgi:ABC-type antimicrobial peptide transport system permease subunit